MPIKTDEFNWHIDTLKAVIENRKPSISFSAKIVSPQEGLYELYLINNGEQNILNSVSITTTWSEGSLVLYDILGQYQEKTLQDKNGIVITGFPPKVGNKIIIAWFRNAMRDNKDISIKVSEVVVNETSQ
jgi:hypothetical protein